MLVLAIPNHETSHNPWPSSVRALPFSSAVPQVGSTLVRHRFLNIMVPARNLPKASFQLQTERTRRTVNCFSSRFFASAMEEAHGNIRSNNENSNHEWFGDNQFSLPEFSISSPSTTETLLQRSDSSHRRNSSLLDSASAVRDQDGQSPSGETGDLSDAGADRGLAISNVEQPTTPSETATPKSTDPFLSPEMSSYKSPKTASFQDSFTSTLHQPFVMDDDTEELNPRTSRASTIRSYQSTGVECPAHCRSKRNIHQGRSNWLAITILILAVYSTIFSGIWLLMAIVRPRWGHRISTTSSFNPGTASLVTALFAKTIELSFVTVFVSFLGQVISRRAFVRQSKGITIAEMSMRSWIMQPGTMITHFESVKHAGLTYLGVIALLAALMAMLYTSASDALGKS